MSRELSFDLYLENNSGVDNWGKVKKEDLMAADRSTVHGSDLDIVAGNGLLHRRMFLTAAAAAAVASSALPNPSAADALPVEPWMKVPGSGFAGYGQPSKYEEKVARTWNTAPGTTGTGAARTPLHLLDGIITPNGVHFERSHSGIPDINPDTHRLLIHGLVKRPLVFTVESLERYPRESRVAFIECGGNGQLLYQKEPAAVGVQAIHGLVSCAEWTGVKLSVLLQEAGVDPKAKWVLAEGADAAGMSRSIPVAKAMDDALIALYQTSKYTITLPDGKSLQFVFPQEGKSVITQPSPGLTMKGPGLYEISGLAWSGYGKITKVEVSADGGKSWANAALQPPVLSKALTRFRMPWRWNGGPAVLQSRATDETGYMQPTREKMIAARGNRTIYHSNAITTWAVSDKGEVKHVYA
jgi:sulfane dehydrogenase subunit SoxC